MISLITKKKFWFFYSYIIKLILKFYGISIGKNFYIEGTPKLKINGKGSNIRLGNNVSIFGVIDLRNREDGKILIEDNVSIDCDVRIVSAREGTIKIGENTSIGPYTIINGGGNIKIGKNVMFARNISINANDHKYEKSKNICEQEYIYKDVLIEDDVWLGSNVCINKGVVVSKGSIVGSNAVVTKDTEPFSINAGVPSKKISERK